MTFIKKISKLGSIGKSKLKENIHCMYLERKIRSTDKKNKKCVLAKKDILNNKIEKIREKESLKRKNIIKNLKGIVKDSQEERVKENKKLNFVNRIEKEFKQIPIITVVDDIVEGASGIEKLKRVVEDNPEEPLNWIILAEALQYYKETFLWINLAKAPIDLMGSLMDLGIEFGSDFLESSIDKDKWTYKRCLLKCLNLAVKSNLEDEKTLVCIGKSAKLLSESCFEPLEKENLTVLKEKYLNKALKICSIENRDEILFYLDRVEGKNIKKFKYGLNKSILKATLNGSVNALVNQSRKLKNTSERILDNSIDKFLKDE
ncbi:hypothetical protein [Clostridium rectalis]|uniref:hypothetical protein n=1 Tax=Clostridium rectalis TaxID=2040295 RepID=UPI000F638F92|nr:hypothetical protein [Clostridium rectalis]